MKCFLFVVFSLILFSSCKKDDPFPEVHTVMLNDKKIKYEEAAKSAPQILVDTYIDSDKSKKFYEVAYRPSGGFILNYFPAKRWLSVSIDQEFDGWSFQFKNVDEKKLEELAASGLGFMEYKTIVELNEPADYSEIKTNGN